MAPPPIPPSLSPLEAALVQTLHAMHEGTIKELRIFRWQTVGLMIFLIGIVALLKGVDPRIASEAAGTLLAPAHTIASPPIIAPMDPDTEPETLPADGTGSP